MSGPTDWILPYVKHIFTFVSQEFACNGTVVEHPEYGTAVLLQEFACNGTVVEHPEYGTAVLLQEFACNGTVVEHPEYGEVIQLQGDQRQHISQFLKKVGLAREDQLKVCTC